VSTPANAHLQAIPVKVLGAMPQPQVARFHWKRRLVQAVALCLFVLIPASGLFRVDPIDGALVVLDRQIWFSDFFLIFGLWFTIATALVLLYSIAGTVFCGWVCPQNSLAEWSNFVTRTLLGKRAEVSLDGDPIRVTASKNRAVNWTVLAALFVLAAMAFALVPMFYFYPPSVVWSFVTLRPDARLAGSLHWIYAVFALIILLDITVLRHFWCRFICVYRVWQHSFRTRQTLHVVYDATRSDDCTNCNFCATNCFIEIDPRNTQTYDSCVNCGECIDACNQMHRKKGEVGLLRFEFGQRAAARLRTFRNNETSLLSRSGWAIPFGVLGAAMLGWGFWSYEPYHLSVDHLQAPTGQEVVDYQISIANKRYRPEAVSVRINGLPDDAYRLSSRRADLARAGRATVILSVAPTLKKGLYPVQIEVHADDGWVGRFSIQHLSTWQGSAERRADAPNERVLSSNARSGRIGG
jgi:polyferredoxin